MDIGNGEDIKLKEQIRMSLTEANKQEISDLIEVCNNNDQTSMDVYLNNRNGKKFIDLLYYEQDEIIGYLVVIPSLQKGIVRITGAVHPNYRKKGIFTNLVNEAKKLIRQSKKKIIFITESNSGKAFLNNLSATYKFSAYNMAYDINKKLINNLLDIEFYTPLESDLNDLVLIGREAFHTGKEEEISHVKQNINDTNINFQMAKINNKIVGTVSSKIVNDKATIANLAVLKSYREKGIGKALLQKTLHDLLNQGIKDIQLSVQAGNESALNLYLNSGFYKVKTNNFYELNIN